MRIDSRYCFKTQISIAIHLYGKSVRTKEEGNRQIYKINDVSKGKSYKTVRREAEDLITWSRSVQRT